jgi:glutathione S-transferase
MKLYYSPGACSLADHVALIEAGVPFEAERVDLKTKLTASGADYRALNPKGYVPALTLDSGETLTENIAVLDWIAGEAPQLQPGGALGRSRLVEALAYIATEVHKAFHPIFDDAASEAEKQAARDLVAAKLRLLAGAARGDYLFGDRPGVADFYLFVMLLWASRRGIALADPLPELFGRLLALPSVQRAMADEGLRIPSSPRSAS